MRIVYFAYSDLNKAGAAKIHIDAIAKGLAERGHDITLVVPEDYGRLEHENIRMVEIGQNPLISPLWAKKAERWLSGHIEEFDGVYLRDFYYSTPILEQARKSGLPSILEINGSLKSEKSVSSEKLKYRLIGDFDWNFFLKRRLKAADKIIAVTPGLVDEYSELIGSRDKFVFLPNGVDTDLFRPAQDKERLRDNLGLSEFKPLLGAVGSILPYHVESPIIRVVEILSEEYSNMGFIFVGGGPGKEELRDRVERSGFKEQFRFIGPVSVEKSADYMAALDIAVVWSTKETARGGWPLRLSAYSACGIPIVGPDWGTYRIFEQIGVLDAAEKGTAENIANKVIKILDDEETVDKMSKIGRKYAVDNLSWNSIIEKTEAVLFELIGN